MFDWQKIITDKNFRSDPIPHFRVENVLSDDIYTELLETYNSSWDATDGYGVITPECTGISDVWRQFADSAYHDIPAKMLEPYFDYEHPDWFVSACALSYHHHDPDDGNIKPGELIRDWHQDGDSKFFNSIYYLGSESLGHIELKNTQTGAELSYEYSGNSILIWRNWMPDSSYLHQFRNSQSGPRRTVYLCWAPKTDYYIDAAGHSIDPETSRHLKKLIRYQGLS